MMRLLLVDDEPGLRRGLAAFLRGCGHQVDEAGGVDEARERIAAARPDLVVTDQCMDDGTGTDLARWIAAEEPGIGVVVVTGYANRELLEGDLPPGVNRVLEKPLRPRELQATLNELNAGLLSTENVEREFAGGAETRTARARRELRGSLWGEEV